VNVGLVIIGNEVLSGTVVDANSHFLERELFALGAKVREVCTLPDEIELVAAKVKEYSSRFDLVITTGGIGPTHDDITYEAVAKAMGVDLVVQPGLEALALRKFKTLNEAGRKLTMVPAGAELLPGSNFIWPPIKCGNVVVLPGIPDMIVAQFPAVAQLVEKRPVVVLEVRCFVHEVVLAEAATAVAKDFPDVEVGSYPILKGPGTHALLRFVGQDRGRTLAAFRSFLRRLPADVRIEHDVPDA
jgi:molybdenum cofactor synthesis domain-containing protein